MTMKLVKPEEMENQVGVSLPAGEWFEIDQARINAFAECTEDHQFIHLDEAAAAQTPFGGTIAHGFLTLVFAHQTVCRKWHLSRRDCHGCELRTG